MTTAPWEELAEQLRARGVEETGVREHVAETTAHLSRTGASFAEEFGTPVEHAVRLTGAPAGPPEDFDRITVYIDVFGFLPTMNQLGADGWELIGRGSTGHVLRRDRHDPHAWEYRSVRHKDVEQIRTLTALGWEPALEMFTRAMYKRPVAAVAGPRARVNDPRPAAHTIRLRWGFRYYLGMIAFLTLLFLTTFGWGGSLLTFVPLIGLALGVSVLQLGHILLVRRRRQAAVRTAAPWDGTTLG